MVRVSAAGESFGLVFPGLDHLPPVALPDYWIDQHEVTNEEFKKFVDAGGYMKSAVLDRAVREGRAGLSPLHDAIASFPRGTTGRPGPATWEARAPFPNGLEKHPVGGRELVRGLGLCPRFAGKHLPTFIHWNRVAAQTVFAPS